MLEELLLEDHVQRTDMPDEERLRLAFKEGARCLASLLVEANSSPLVVGLVLTSHKPIQEL